VVSLPRAFVFRVSLDDPHPFPWIRVLLSCVVGAELYPHQQWGRLARLWESYYPAVGLDPQRAELIAKLRSTMSDFAGFLANHRPPALRGQSLSEALGTPDRRAEPLADEFAAWRTTPEQMWSADPTLAFAAIGQARMDGRISPEEESQILADLLK